MPVLTKGGLDLPVGLLEAQASGQLVVFAGAGVSMPAGLPNFESLVKQIYRRVNEEIEGYDKTLLKEGKFDRLLGRLEGTVGARMREEAIATLETPEDWDQQVHQDLVDIARFEDKIRLVTTNFDRLFVEVIQNPSKISAAPRLPVPRKGLWDGVVHLHGLIGKDDPEGSNLILTNADFGRAYLLDAWASRFVTELVRNFNVLFVGYSVNDPVMRYLIDSLQAERARGENFKEAFALAGIQGRKGYQKRQREDWSNKGLTPIIYYSGYNHRALTKTLRAWGELSRRGLRTRRRWALRQLEHPPSNPQEDEVRLKAWALAEPSGSVAKAFVEHDPPIEWLNVLDQCELAPGVTLFRWGLSDSSHHPSTQDRGVPLADGGQHTQPAPLSQATFHLGRWIANRLDQPETLDWVVRQGGMLHPSFRRKVETQLNNLIGPPEQGTLRSRLIWRVLASEVYSERRSREIGNLPDVNRALQEAPESTTVKRELLRLLEPVPLFSSAHAFWHPSDIDSQYLPRIRVSMSLSGRATAELLLKRLTDPGTAGKLIKPFAEHAPDLLQQVMDYLEELGKANSSSDESHVHHPSIIPHPQNRHFEEWTYLVDLNRRAFEVLNQSDPRRAKQLVNRWHSSRFPVFRRLVIHAATVNGAVPPSFGLKVLLENKGKGLWGLDERRECLRFLRKAAPHLAPKHRARLVNAILGGIPTSELPEDIDQDKYKRTNDSAIWLRLSRLVCAGIELPTPARERIERLESEYTWSVPQDFRDEFPFFIEMGLPVVVSESQEEEWLHFVDERPRAALLKLLAKRRRRNWDDPCPYQWRSLLSRLEQPTKWNDREEKQFILIANCLSEAPNEFLLKVLDAATYWLLQEAKILPEDCEPLFIRLWDRAAPPALEQEVLDFSDVLSRALNHPAGILTDALLRRLWRSPKKEAGIPNNLRTRLESIVNSDYEAARLVRALCAASLNSLFLINASWVEVHLLPYFSWSHDTAIDMWKSYLWNPRWSPGLVSAFKPHFLQLFEELPEGQHLRDNACRLLVVVSIYEPDSLAASDVRKSLRNLVPKDLARVASALTDFLTEDESPQTAWEATVEPWIKQHWPQSLEYRVTEVSVRLADLIIETKGAFPGAVDCLLSFLVPITSYSSLDEEMLEQNLGRIHPHHSLQLLERVVPGELLPWSWPRLRQLLDSILESDPSLEETTKFKRLDEILLRAGQ